MNNINLNLKQPNKEKMPCFWIDMNGNQYSQSANLETWTCKLKDGSLGCGWTAEEAFQRALGFHNLFNLKPEDVEKINGIADDIRNLSENLILIHQALHGKPDYKKENMIQLDHVGIALCFDGEHYENIYLDKQMNQGILELIQSQHQFLIENKRKEFKKFIESKKDDTKNN